AGHRRSPQRDRDPRPCAPETHDAGIGRAQADSDDPPPMPRPPFPRGWGVGTPARTAPMKRQLHLNLFIHSRGHHEASWRHRGSSLLPLTDIRYYQDLAQRAETALFDSLFLADQLALGGDVAQAPRTWPAPPPVL